MSSFPLSLCLARYFWPDLVNGRHAHTNAVCVSLRWSGDVKNKNKLSVCVFDLFKRIGLFSNRITRFLMVLRQKFILKFHSRWQKSLYIYEEDELIFRCLLAQRRHRQEWATQPSPVSSAALKSWQLSLIVMPRSSTAVDFQRSLEPDFDISDTLEHL